MWAEIEDVGIQGFASRPDLVVLDIGASRWEFRLMTPS